MKKYMEKLKKINGSGQCAFVLVIAEKILRYEELKVEDEIYDFVKKVMKLYWDWLNEKIFLDYDDIYCTIGIKDEGEDFSTYYEKFIDKYGHDNICNKYALILKIFYILASHIQGKEMEYYRLDGLVCDIGDGYIEDLIEKTLKQKIISESELYLLLDYLNQKYSSYCEICRNDVIATMKNKNEMFIEKGYKLRNYRRTNGSAQCAFVLMIAERVLNGKKLDKTENIYQFAEEKIAYCWKWLNGEIKGKENIEKVICTEDEDKNIYLSRCWRQEDEKNQLYATICRAISIVKRKALLLYDEYNYIDDALTNQIYEPIKLNIITEEEYNNLIDYLDNAYPNYPSISKKEIMNLLGNSEV